MVPPAPIGESEPPRYDKLVLTPFGETMPGISRFEWLEQALLDFGARGMSFDLDAGSSAVRFEVESAAGERFAVATPICFEATVSWLCRSLVWTRGERTAELLVNTSNDGWLGDDDAARWTHLRLASLRAIENRTPMLRAVNTGYSAGIDSSGRIVAGLDGANSRVGTGTGWVVAELPRDGRRPLFALLGDRWAWLAVAAAAVLAVFTRSRR
jgi:apolipoprotein N-acyltransferase